MADFENGLPPENVDMQDVKIKDITISSSDVVNYGITDVMYTADPHPIEQKHPQISLLSYATKEITKPNYMTFI